MGRLIRYFHQVYYVTGIYSKSSESSLQFARHFYVIRRVIDAHNYMYGFLWSIYSPLDFFMLIQYQ